MLPKEELDAIKERCENATEGPWKYYHEDGEVATSDKGYCFATEISEEIGYDGNGEFIANAREDIPKLLSEIDELRNRLDDVEGLLEDALGDLDDMYLNLHNTKTYDDIMDYFEKNEPITRRDGE